MGQEQDLAVIGAGPHALTFCAYLLRQRPQLRERLVIIDPEGWLRRWQHRLDALGIDTLRSHYTDHPHPDPYALWRFSRSHLQRRLRVHYTPGATLFADFCRSLVTELGLDEVVCPERAEWIDPASAGLCIGLASGETMRAGRVVLATNPGVPRLPAWAWDAAGQAPAGRLVHSEQLDVRGLRLADQRVLVLGAGLTAGQLALGALAQGAGVVLASRSALRVGVFDVSGCWQVPACLRELHREPVAARRVELLRTAKPGGSMTPAVAEALRQPAGPAARTVNLLEGVTVRSARWKSDHWQVTVAGHTSEAGRILETDWIWLATGTTQSVVAEPLLRGLAATRPAEITEGLPMLDRACRWPGTQLHVMGGLASLQIGPFARNLIGARMAAERIVAQLTPLRRHQYYRGPAISDHPEIPLAGISQAW
ncbi:MAG: FAD/NAD(P)-binding protein [Pseudonocardiaceae bacterium]